MRREKRARAEEAEKLLNPDPPQSETPFQRFEEFARKVLSVPKAEIDKREREYRENRKQGKTPPG